VGKLSLAGSVVSSRTSLVKILARGELTKALTVRAHKFSGKAAEKVAAAGGTVEAIPDGKAEAVSS